MIYCMILIEIKSPSNNSYLIKFLQRNFPL